MLARLLGLPQLVVVHPTLLKVTFPFLQAMIFCYTTMTTTRSWTFSGTDSASTKRPRWPMAMPLSQMPLETMPLRNAPPFAKTAPPRSTLPSSKLPPADNTLSTRLRLAMPTTEAELYPATSSVPPPAFVLSETASAPRWTPLPPVDRAWRHTKPIPFLRKRGPRLSARNVHSPGSMISNFGHRLNSTHTARARSVTSALFGRMSLYMMPVVKAFQREFVYDPRICDHVHPKKFHLLRLGYALDIIMNTIVILHRMSPRSLGPHHPSTVRLAMVTLFPTPLSTMDRCTPRTSALTSATGCA